MTSGSTQLANSVNGEGTECSYENSDRPLIEPCSVYLLHMTLGDAL